MNKKDRFPGIDWYCDNCGALLNAQNNFSDSHYLWKCTECGYKTSISLSNISFKDAEIPISTKILGYILAISRSIVLYFIINNLLFKYDVIKTSNVLKLNLHESILFYVILCVLSMIFEIKIVKCLNSLWHRVSEPFWYIIVDVIRPVQETISFFKSLFHIKNIGFINIIIKFIYVIILFCEIKFILNLDILTFLHIFTN